MPEMFDCNLIWKNVKKMVVAATRMYVLLRCKLIPYKFVN